MVLIVFTARRIAQTMLSQDVCSSARPSVTRRYCVETAKHVELFSHHSSFYCTKPDGNIPMGVECMVMNKYYFRPISGFVSAMIQYTATVIMECE